MKAGHLSDYFSGVAAKRLSAVEADRARSNQHEFNGDEGLQHLFGEARREVAADFIYLDDSGEPATEGGSLTWYDARLKHPKRSEFRLYFTTTSVSQRAAEGDLLVVALRKNGNALVLVAQGESTTANQVLWLFGFDAATHPGFSVRQAMETERDQLGFVSRFILEQIGVATERVDDAYLGEILAKFGPRFPTTRDFSAFARSLVDGVQPAADPDGALMAWMDREEILFRTLEKHLLEERLAQGFRGDVDAFLSLSLSIQNRRKSRVGLALENHLEHLFEKAGLRYDRAPVTEGRSRPDFLFPGATEYRNDGFNPGLLTMLGVKSTCKERWRQVLAEADRIPRKHLLTLESAISGPQTDEMARANLSLVVPRSIQPTFKERQRDWLLSLEQFIEIVRERQSEASRHD